MTSVKRNMFYVMQRRFVLVTAVLVATTWSAFVAAEEGSGGSSRDAPLTEEAAAPPSSCDGNTFTEAFTPADECGFPPGTHVELVWHDAAVPIDPALELTPLCGNMTLRWQSDDGRSGTATVENECTWEWLCPKKDSPVTAVTLSRPGDAEEDNSAVCTVERLESFRLDLSALGPFESLARARVRDVPHCDGLYCRAGPEFHDVTPDVVVEIGEAPVAVLQVRKVGVSNRVTSLDERDTIHLAYIAALVAVGFFLSGLLVWQWKQRPDEDTKRIAVAGTLALVWSSILISASFAHPTGDPFQVLGFTSALIAAGFGGGGVVAHLLNTGDQAAKFATATVAPATLVGSTFSFVNAAEAHSNALAIPALIMVVMIGGAVAVGFLWVIKSTQS